MMKDLQHVKIPGSKFDVEILEFRDNPAERFWIKARISTSSDKLQFHWYWHSEVPGTEATFTNGNQHFSTPVILTVLLVWSDPRHAMAT